MLPFVAGVSAFFGTWALDMRPDLGVLGLVLGVLGAGGMFLTQLITTGEKRAHKAINELQAEAHRQRESGLDDLARRLGDDRDERTETALADLRELAKALDLIDDGVPDTDEFLDESNPMVIEIKLVATALLSQCIQSLEHSLKLWHTAERMRTISARKPILEQREEIVKDVYRSIRDLGNLLVSFQNLGTADDTTSELTRIRKELDDNLKMARQVDARLKEFEHEVARKVRE